MLLAATGGRSWSQCAKKWRDLRNAVETDKIYSRRTEGGEAAPPAPCEDVVLSLIGQNTTKTNGIEGGIDTVMVAVHGDSGSQPGHGFEEDGGVHKRDHQEEQTAASVIDLPLQYSPVNGLRMIETNVQPLESTSKTSDEDSPSSSATVATPSTSRPVSRTGPASSTFFPRRIFQKRPSGIRHQGEAAPEEEETLFKEWLKSEIERNKAQTERERVETEVWELKKKKLEQEQELLTADGQSKPPCPLTTPSR